MKTILQKLILSVTLSVLSLYVSATCTAHFTYSQSSPNVIDFSATATGATAPLYWWTFDNGASNGFGANTSYTYGSPGTYYVCVYMSDSLGGCAGVSYCDSVIVTGSVMCTAHFTFTQPSPGTIQFTASSTSSGYPFWEYEWSFGDGMGAATGNSVYNYTYSTPGTYNVCVTMHDSASLCNATYCHNVTATGCNLSTTMTPTSASCDTCGDGSVSVSLTGGTGPYTYSWGYPYNFVTGNTLANIPPGWYSVCVTDINSCTACDSVYVGYLAGGCHAHFTHTISSSFASFVNNSTGTGLGTNYYWTFGDGGTSSQMNPTHTYLTTGAFEVCLHIVDTTLNCSDTFCDSIAINSFLPCSANFALFPDSLVPHLYYGYNLATGVGALTYLWVWGDGGTDNTAFPSHTYASAGTYNICLTITDAVSCTNTYCNSTAIARMASGPPVTVNIINSPAGVHEVAKAEDVSIYPNPSSGSTTIQYSLSSSSDVRIRVYDVLGNEVKEIVNGRQAAGENKHELNTSQMAGGIYMLNFTINGKTTTKKLVVNN